MNVLFSQTNFNLKQKLLKLIKHCACIFSIMVFILQKKLKAGVTTKMYLIRPGMVKSDPINVFLLLAQLRCNSAAANVHIYMYSQCPREEKNVLVQDLLLGPVSPPLFQH